MKEVKIKYDEIAKKKGLPNWDELDAEYELGYMAQLAEISHPLRFVRRRINDRLAWAANFFQGLLHPNPNSLVSMQESKFFTEMDRKKMMELLKELMQLERMALSIDIANDDEETAKWIKEAHKKWKSHKKDLIDIANKMKEGWKEEFKTGKGGAYFG